MSTGSKLNNVNNLNKGVKFGGISGTKNKAYLRAKIEEL